MAFSFAVLLVVFGVNFYVAEFKLSSHVAPGARMMQIIAPLIGFLILIPTFLVERSRISHFRIEDNVLVLGRKRFPMEGLLEVAKDPDVLRRAIKLFGNGGLGSIRGKYRSKRLGVFYAFLTDTQTAVVLKWPTRPWRSHRRTLSSSFTPPRRRRTSDEARICRNLRMADDRKAFLLRVDPLLWKEIERWSADELRSVNGQIEFILRDAVRRRRKGGGGELRRGLRRAPSRFRNLGHCVKRQFEEIFRSE